MKIVFVARHNCGDNDDEGAIAHALRELGHEVECVHEKPRHRQGVDLASLKGDFCLFLKWPSPGEIAQVRMPRVFWFFDLVDSADPTLHARAASRVQWMRDAAPLCVAGFCTDGDWVARDTTGKLVHLMQGADERVAGFGKPTGDCPPILFTGMIHHGQRRASHIAELQAKFGKRFGMLGSAGPADRKHGRALADAFASTKVVVAPDGPNSDRYWSNRVYLTLGLGGFLLHPYCSELAKQYLPGTELVYYHSRRELEGLIGYYLTHDAEREQLRIASHAKTMTAHTYRHRCEELVRIVKERL